MHKKIIQFACAVALVLSGAASAAVIGSNNTPINIPDSNGSVPGTVNSLIEVANHGSIAALSVSISANHTWIGDLIFTLTHGATTVTLMDRPGMPANGSFGNDNDISALYPLTFSDLAGLPAAETMGNCGAGVIGSAGACANTAFRSDQALSAFDGGDMFGAWTLTISDNSIGDTGNLSAWSLSGTVANDVAEPGILTLMGLALAGMGAARRKSGK